MLSFNWMLFSRDKRSFSFAGSNGVGITNVVSPDYSAYGGLNSFRAVVQERKGIILKLCHHDMELLDEYLFFWLRLDLTE